MVTIPEDIISHILVRLPIKSIGRCRCVSKTWCKLLKDRKFIKMHLNHANDMNNFNIMRHNLCFTEFFTMGCDPSSSTCSDPVNVICPFLSDMYRGCAFWGSCNGLVCLTCCEPRDVNYGPHNVVIWNPCTNEYKKLPLSPSEESINRLSPGVNFGLRVGYRFMYDHKMADLKVVSLGIYNYQYLCEIHVYTLGSNTWRRLEDIPYDLCRPLALPELALVPINGALHWKAIRESMGQEIEVILSFNTETEMFEEFQMPNLFGFITTLCVLKESLCLLGYISMCRVELWELKDYRVKDSWARIFTIDIQKPFGHCADLIPLRSFENGEILFGIDRVFTDGTFNVVLYDPEHETTRTLQVYGSRISYAHHHFVYKESLVSLNSGANLRHAEIEDEENESE